MQRLDKILSDAGFAGRKEIKEIIRAGRVQVNGVTCKKPEQKFPESEITLTLDKEPVGLYRRVLLMMHKPAGYVTATEDGKEKTVMELLPDEYRRLQVKPVGRLDKETEGLLLFTNDGALLHKIISPKSEIKKVYYAKHEGTVSQQDTEAFQNGILLSDGMKCLPAELCVLGECEAEITVMEGKYHQVRRMMASRGLTVTYLRRISEGKLQLGDLPLGQCKEVDFSIF